MGRYFKTSFLPAALAIVLSFSSIARADTLSAVGGLTFGRDSGGNEIKTPSPLLGADYVFRLVSRIWIGGFYFHNMLSYKTGASGAINYGGIVGRLFFKESGKDGLFLDGTVGVGERTIGQDDPGSGKRIGFGAGAGYELPLTSFLGVSPHFGVRFLPDAPVSTASIHALYDYSLMVSFHF